MIALGALGTGQEVALGPSAKAATHHTHVLWKQKTKHLSMPLPLFVCVGMGVGGQCGRSQSFLLLLSSLFFKIRSLSEPKANSFT